jgi:hypothetical protein
MKIVNTLKTKFWVWTLKQKWYIQLTLYCISESIKKLMHSTAIHKSAHAVCTACVTYAPECRWHHVPDGVVNYKTKARTTTHVGGICCQINQTGESCMQFTRNDILPQLMSLSYYNSLTPPNNKYRYIFTVGCVTLWRHLQIEAAISKSGLPQFLHVNCKPKTVQSIKWR